MFVRCLAFIRKSAPLAGVAVLLLAGRKSGFCEEPTPKLEPAKKQEPAPERKNILDYRAYRPSDSVFKSSGINLPAPAAPATQAPPPRLSRQDRDLLDQQKNWIFVLPGDTKKNDAAADVFGVDQAFDDESSKSVLTRFLENRRAAELKSLDANASRDPIKDAGAPKVFGVGNEKQNRLGAWAQPESSLGNLFGKSVPEMTLAEQWQELHGTRAEKTREEKRIRMNAFESLFGSQSTAAGNVGFNTLQNNLGLPAATPASSGSDFLSQRAPSVPGSFRSPSLPLAGANALTPPNINLRVFGPSSAPALVPEPARPAPPPIVLQIPKRHL